MDSGVPWPVPDIDAVVPFGRDRLSGIAEYMVYKERVGNRLVWITSTDFDRQLFYARGESSPDSIARPRTNLRHLRLSADINNIY